MGQVEPSVTAFAATKLPNTAMHLQDRLATCLLVQSIDILGDESETENALFKINQRAVTSIRLRVVNQPTTPAIPLPNQIRIAFECRRRSQIFRSKLFPQARRSAKGGDAALRGNARPG